MTIIFKVLWHYRSSQSVSHHSEWKWNLCTCIFQGQFECYLMDKVTLEFHYFFILTTFLGLPIILIGNEKYLQIYKFSVCEEYFTVYKLFSFTISYLRHTKIPVWGFNVPIFQVKTVWNCFLLVTPDHSAMELWVHPSSLIICLLLTVGC